MRKMQVSDPKQGKVADHDQRFRQEPYPAMMNPHFFNATLMVPVNMGQFLHMRDPGGFTMSIMLLPGCTGRSRHFLCVRV